MSTCKYININVKSNNPNIAYLLHLKDKTARVADIEEEVADNGGGLTVDHLQTRSETVVTRAMHHLRK